MRLILGKLDVSFLLLMSVVLASAPLPGVAADANDIDVHVEKDGSNIRVTIELTVEATQAEAWNVLTDYEAMARFVPTVESSVVLKRDGNDLEVAQQGKATHGPLTFRFANVRRVALTPMTEIRSRIVSGDLSPGEVVTTLDSNGTMTHVLVKGVYVPNIWVPPVIGPAIIAAETKEQWQVLRKEILHRRAARG